MRKRKRKMDDKNTTKIETRKYYDSDKGYWVACYKEYNHSVNSKNEWDWSGESGYNFLTEAEADAKLVELNTAKTEKESNLRLK